MDMEFKFGLITQSIKANGLMTKLMVKEYCIIQMEIDIKDILKIKKRMVQEHTIIRMELFIQVIGLMICSKDMELKFGTMDPNIKETLKME